MNLQSAYCSDMPSLGIDSERTVRVLIKGIVQGVGFRPFVFQLAGRYGLNGWVRNQSDGVEIEASGPAESIAMFLHDLPRMAPPLARIIGLEVWERPLRRHDGFSIISSRANEARTTLISPDVCTCPDCLRELLDPRDRRYRYPFINCTNCGPRYTIIQDIPYDRGKTTMAAFAMCAACREEYEDPRNRRFHAQPNACWDCGPQLWLEDSGGRILARKDEALQRSIALLAEGSIVAVKGLGGFHLAVDAGQEAAVSRLRGRKIREEKPFAVMFPGIAAIRRCCRVSEEEALLLEGPQRPIVLLEKSLDGAQLIIAPSVAPRNRLLGCFLPYTPVHHLLFQDGPLEALVMTSGNQSDEPIVMENDEAKRRLKNIADFFLLHDRDIHLRCDDSVARVQHRRPRLIRRARGYAPMPIFLEKPLPSVLAVGAELKNTICLTRRKEAFLSQHIGDLENLATLRSFELTIAHLKTILEIEPQCIAHDLHPNYLGTQWAEAQNGVPRIGVQHHHAHIAAVLAEATISGPVLGLALDGTGYGADGTIWGGEVLRVDGNHCDRLGHFRHAPMPGNDAAIREPWRMALSYLWGLERENVFDRFADILARWPAAKVKVIIQMLEKGLNTSLTSSCGRLFDAVSSLAGLRDAVAYEGQAAIELEQAMGDDAGRYRGELRTEQGMLILDPLPMIAEMVGDIRRKRDAGVISARFHRGIVSLLVDAAAAARDASGIDQIALSGGVFQNAYIAHHLHGELTARGFAVFTHQEAPPNDACISLGQAYVAAHRLLRMEAEPTKGSLATLNDTRC